MIVPIDNHDSFTFNLVIIWAGWLVGYCRHRNDAVTADDVVAARPDAIVKLSPGPCTPDEAGILPPSDRQGCPHQILIPGVRPGHQGGRIGTRRRSGACALARSRQTLVIARHEGGSVFQWHQWIVQGEYAITG